MLEYKASKKGEESSSPKEEKGKKFGKGVDFNDYIRSPFVIPLIGFIKNK
jgi:hypothetical protein